MKTSIHPRTIVTILWRYLMAHGREERNPTHQSGRYDQNNCFLLWAVTGALLGMPSRGRKLRVIGTVGRKRKKTCRPVFIIGSGKVRTDTA
jgi:hypothetical protein